MWVDICVQSLIELLGVGAMTRGKSGRGYGDVLDEGHPPRNGGPCQFARVVYVLTMHMYVW